MPDINSYTTNSVTLNINGGATETPGTEVSFGLNYNNEKQKETLGRLAA